MSDPACRACRKPLIWARTPSGAKAPIERDADERGNVLLLRSAALDDPLAVVLSGDLLDEAKGSSVALRLNHFAYCPERERFRKKPE